MTKIQFEMLTAYYGMVRDGCSKEQAVGLVVMMGYEREDIRWFVQKIQMSKQN